MTSKEELYGTAALIRIAEEMLVDEYHPADEMRCPIHFCIGQEGLPAALAPLLKTEDTVVCHYRSHGHYLAKGAPLDGMVAEFYGKITGSNHGLAGSMELACHDVNFYSGAIVAGHIGLAVGAAFEKKYKKLDSIALCVFGDGAMDEGVTFESINLAVLKQLPVVFICENNGYAAHTAIPLRAAAPDLLARAQSFGVPCHRLNDSDIPALHEALDGILAGVRAGNGPVFLEVSTYRFCAHVGPESDDHLQYRPLDEVDARRKQDPVMVLRDALAAETGSNERADAIDGDVRKAVASAIEKAKAAEFPALDWALAQSASNSYSPLVTAFRSDDAVGFEGAQAEAKLEPY